MASEKLRVVVSITDKDVRTNVATIFFFLFFPLFSFGAFLLFSGNGKHVHDAVAPPLRH